MESKAFISYSRKNQAAATLLVEALAEHGVTSWMDLSSLRLGQHYDTETESAIRRCPVFILLLSAPSIQSDYVRFELAAALHAHRIIAPICLDDIDVMKLPAPFSLKLGSLQCVRWHGTKDETLQALARDIGGTVLQQRKRKRATRNGLIALMALFAAVAGGWFFMTRTPDPGLCGASHTVDAAPTMPAEGLSEIPPPVPVKDLQESAGMLPAFAPLHVVSTDAPPEASAPAVLSKPKLALRIEARLRGKDPVVLLNDGSSLASLVDGYRLVVSPFSDGHLYVFQVDTVGKCEWLFPTNPHSQFSCGSNPVHSGQEFLIPDRSLGSMLTLDETTGVEHLYIVLSATAWPELEKTLRESSIVSQKTVTAKMTPLPEPTGLVKHPFGLSRGVHGVLGAVTSPPTAPTPPLPPATSSLFASDGPFMVIERWFYHLPRPPDAAQ